MTDEYIERIGSHQSMLNGKPYAIAIVSLLYFIRWLSAILKSNRNRKHFIPGYPNKILICSTNETYFEFQFPTISGSHPQFSFSLALPLALSLSFLLALSLFHTLMFSFSVHAKREILRQNENRGKRIDRTQTHSHFEYQMNHCLSFE